MVKEKICRLTIIISKVIFISSLLASIILIPCTIATPALLLHLLFFFFLLPQLQSTERKKISQISCLHVETWPINLSRPLINELLCEKLKVLKRIHAKAMIKCPGVFADRGTVQKVIVLPRDDLQTEELVLEEVEVFKVRSNFFVLGCCCCFLGGLHCIIMCDFFSMNVLGVFLD